MFFDILAEELARRDMDDAAIDESNFAELTRRMDAYMAEFEAARHRPCAGRERSDLNSRKGLTHTVGEPFSARGVTVHCAHELPPLADSSRTCGLSRESRRK